MQVKTFLQTQLQRMQDQITLLTRLRDDFQAAMTTFHECASCKEDWMRRRCSSCDVMAREALPPTVRTLWLEENASAEAVDDQQPRERPAAPNRPVGPVIS